MTKQEFAGLIASLMSTTALRLEKPEIAFWYSCLSDLPDRAVAMAVRRFAMSGDAWPSIAKLRALAAEYIDGRQMDWGEAWELLRRAGRIWSQHDRALAEEAHSLLTPRLEKILRTLGGFIVLTEAEGDKLSVLQSNFRSAWTMRNEQQAEDRCLPEELRPRIAAEDRAERESKPRALPPHTHADIGNDSPRVAKPRPLTETELPAVRLLAESMAVATADGEVA